LVRSYREYVFIVGREQRQFTEGRSLLSTRKGATERYDRRDPDGAIT
jgi:hypothetical protein